MNFSVLICIHIKSVYKDLIECFESIKNQSILPSEIILICDGPLRIEIVKIKNLYPYKNLKIFKLKQNVGLGNALKYGLKKCNNEIVFRMDSDDICLPERFKIQLREILKDPNLAVLGTNVILIDKNSNNILNKARQVPLSNRLIKKNIKIKNPFNHPSVVFRKSKVIEVGSYEEVNLYEDWYLWFKLTAIKKNKFRNLEKPLLKYRIRSFDDRRGLKVFKKEFRFYLALLDNSYINKIEFIIFILIKLLIRISPKFIYLKFKSFSDKIS